jgi:hypothetical protein
MNMLFTPHFRFKRANIYHLFHAFNAQTSAGVTRGGASPERDSVEKITIKGNFESVIIHVKQNYFAPQLGTVGKELCV